MWVANFPFSISSQNLQETWQIIIIIILRSHNNNNNNNNNNNYDNNNKNEGITIRKANCMIHRLPHTVVLTNKMLLNFDKI